MEYELAKELNEAGFPFKHFDWIENFYTEYSFLNNGDGSVGVPLLSELIEACGGDFTDLWRRPGELNGNIWTAITNFRITGKRKGATGKTPEEAVARLWLVLNKKT